MIPTASGIRDPLAPVRVVGVGTAVPTTSYTQSEILDIFRIDDPRVRSVLLNSAIDRRYLTLPPEGSDGRPVPELQGELLGKHKQQAVDMAVRAVTECLKEAGAAPGDIGHLCCVTSTGFLTPGLSALVLRELGIDRHCGRLDVVGMGCNAGLNALSAVSGWAQANPGQLAVMVCAEACSAAYVFDGTMRTSVVNSLFGDGAAAIAAVSRAGTEDRPGPEILKFASVIIPEAMDAMRFDWDAAQEKFSFFLDPEVPYVVGAHAEDVVTRLLDGTGLRRSEIGHWLIHSGGKKVIDTVMVNLGLSRHDVRHTTAVLRDYGNLSSGSFLFSYQRLLDEGVTRPGEYGVLMTMGPGSTIETALVRW
ncbi:type III polyketide synthase (plasmid) [Streptomyces cellulosae]|uniref:3,5-dihydroxyphenylacetyl-CoA synthase DpgA n=1 Tax=Streptomyces cellulosae TaxID=1968 RepID=UPI002F909FBA|nr:type III polyketide synthase [Streptomyces cellulosae]WTB85970.1 type III polyketide synthase [Streptomyces cellulosae]WTB86408.1 type III polyketide synthase [Streptomyces cellulosae]WTB86698.1 type III polyketide synthase [Streptomyces cellulosae]